MRYKALPASLRQPSTPGSEGPPKRGGGISDPILRWTATLLMLALFPAALLPSILAQAATAVLTVAPATTEPGSSVLVHGSAFASRSRGVLQLDTLTAPAVNYRADSSGEFAVVFKIPESTAPGGHTLFASGSATSKARAAALASASFMVVALGSSLQPSASVSQSSSPRVSASPAETPSLSPPTTPSASPKSTSLPYTPFPSPTTSPGGTSLRFPIRAAFYYPWFPEGWSQQGMNPFTHYHPSLGYYDGSSPAVLKSQIASMQYGNIAAGIASWWGIGTKTDLRIPALLDAAAGTGFRWALYYEPEGVGNPSATQIGADLAYIASHYASDPSYLRVDGRFVVFAYGDAADSCTTADRWHLANTVGAYVVLKVFSGYRTCASQPDGWHQYGPASPTDAQAGYSFSISPGFFKANESTPRLARDLARWSDDVRQMIASGAPFQLITTFNEWGEGTSVESAAGWQSSSGYGSYLDALHHNGVP